MAEDPGVPVRRGRLNDAHRAQKPADAGELQHAIRQTRERMTSSLDALGGRLAPAARAGWLAKRASSSPFLRQHDLVSATIATIVAVRQLAPLVRVTFPKRTLQVTLICIGSVAALAIAAWVRSSRRSPQRGSAPR